MTIPLRTYGNLPPEAAIVCCGPEATTFLSHRGVYTRPEAATVPQGFISQKSRLKSGHLVTLCIRADTFKGYLDMWLSAIPDTSKIDNYGVSEIISKQRKSS